MHAAQQTIEVYQELAVYYESENKPRMRDIFLLLAAESAMRADLVDEAERLRQKLLSYNPHHLLKPYMSFAQALESTDVQFLLDDLREKYPPIVAKEMLDRIWEESHSDEVTLDEPGPVIPLGGQDIPGTAPVIDMDEPPTMPPQKRARPVLPMQRDQKPRQAPPRKEEAPPPPPPRPTKSSTLSTPMQHFDQEVPPTVPLGTKSPFMDEQARPRSRTFEPQPEQGADTPPRTKNGAWFATLLMLITFLGSLALLGYALVEPFLAKN